jgi:hypothetical protein
MPTNSSEESTFHFDGFEDPTYTQIPDVFFDVIMCQLSEAELRVALYIMRRTFGFKKRRDAISLSQFLKGIVTRDGERLDAGCGLTSPTHLSTALKGLEGKGIIRRVQQFDERGGNRPTLYALHFRQDPLPQRQDRLPEGYPPPTAAVDPPPHFRVDPPLPFGQTQETVIQETENKTTDQQQTDLVSRSSKGSLTQPKAIAGLNVEERHGAETDLEDDLVPTPDLDAAIEQSTRELGDQQHGRSNRTRAQNLMTQYAVDEFTMVKLVQTALTETKRHAGQLQNPAAYFFGVVEDRLKTIPGAKKSLAGRYWRQVRR